MKYFNINQAQLFYSFTLPVKEKQKIDGIQALLEKSGVAELLLNIDETPSRMGRPEYDRCLLFFATVLGFAYGFTSLRELESSFRYDIRFLYLFGDQVPDHSTLSRFINETVKPNEREIFTCIMKVLLQEMGVTNDVVFIDGTKQQAKSNKNKFVWKPITFHERLTEKSRNLLDVMGLGKDVPSTGLIKSELLVKKLEEAEEKSPEELNATEKAYSKMKSNLAGYLFKALEYEEKERICGNNRNSYYKTDHDATAMCLKQDYYSGLGSNMHAAYSVQLIVSSGLVSCYWVNQKRTDLYAFTPTLDIFHAMYGKYPKKIGADAGYGCTVNYKYCEMHGIEAFIKYQDWEGEKSGRRPAAYELREDGTIICLGGRIGKKVSIPDRHPRRKGAVFYLVEGCMGCPYMTYCRRYQKELVGQDKIFEVNPEFQKYKIKARDLLLSPEGIEMRVNRSCQVEGAFGMIKQDMEYTRFRRTSLPKVSTEFMLTCLGFNMRKYMRFLAGESNMKYWIAPKDLEPEIFRKPSAKRLTNRVIKKKSKQPNEIARDSYKYKHKC